MKHDPTEPQVLRKTVLYCQGCENDVVVFSEKTNAVSHCPMCGNNFPVIEKVECERYSL